MLEPAATTTGRHGQGRGKPGLLSGGRFELGLGAGAFWDAIEAYGGPRRAPAEALGALAEAIEVIRKVWSGERNLRLDGRTTGWPAPSPGLSQPIRSGSGSESMVLARLR